MESGIHRHGIRNPQRGIRNPGLSWITLHGARLGHESARAPLCKLATCTRQIFLSKLKRLQTRQTNRKNKKQSKAEIGYD